MADVQNTEQQALCSLMEELESVESELDEEFNVIIRVHRARKYLRPRQPFLEVEIAETADGHQVAGRAGSTFTEATDLTRAHLRADMRNNGYTSLR